MSKIASHDKNIHFIQCLVLCLVCLISGQQSVFVKFFKQNANVNAKNNNNNNDKS